MIQVVKGDDRGQAKLGTDQILLKGKLRVVRSSMVVPFWGVGQNQLMQNWLSMYDERLSQRRWKQKLYELQSGLAGDYVKHLDSVKDVKQPGSSCNASATFTIDSSSAIST